MLKVILYTVIFIAGFVGISLFNFYSVTRPPKIEIPLTPQDFNLTAEEIEIVSEEGLKLSGWFIEPLRTSTQGRALIVLHGYPADKRDMLGVALHMYPDFAILLLDLRSFGESEGSRTSFGIHERGDIQKAIDFLASRGYEKIGLFGFSLGGAISLMTGVEDKRVLSRREGQRRPQRNADGRSDAVLCIRARVPGKGVPHAVLDGSWVQDHGDDSVQWRVIPRERQRAGAVVVHVRGGRAVNQQVGRDDATHEFVERYRDLGQDANGQLGQGRQERDEGIDRIDVEPSRRRDRLSAIVSHDATVEARFAVRHAIERQRGRRRPVDGADEINEIDKPGPAIKLPLQRLQLLQARRGGDVDLELHSIRAGGDRWVAGRGSGHGRIDGRNGQARRRARRRRATTVGHTGPV